MEHTCRPADLALLGDEALKIMLKKSQLSGQLQNRETLQQQPQQQQYQPTTQKIFVPDSTQNTNSSQNLKSSEQECNFLFCFFLPTPPRGPCARASGIVALRVVTESKV
jgi:hypothetical protein